jgi:hypothetical protein
LVVFRSPGELSVKFNQIVRDNPKDGKNGRLRGIRFAEPDPRLAESATSEICRLPGEILARHLALDDRARLFLQLVVFPKLPLIAQG